MGDLNHAISSLFLNFTLESLRKHSELPEAWKRDQAAYRLSDCLRVKKKRKEKSPQVASCQRANAAVQMAASSPRPELSTPLSLPVIFTDYKRRRLKSGDGGLLGRL